MHPGGPFWRKKDVGAWQIPKGELEPGEEPTAAARREVAEELGAEVDVPLMSLGEVRQAGGKQVLAYAAAFDIDPDAMVSNMVEIEWPHRSGRKIMIPEIDAARWLPIEQAREVMLASQLSCHQRHFTRGQSAAGGKTHVAIEEGFTRSPDCA